MVYRFLLIALICMSTGLMAQSPLGRIPITLVDNLIFVEVYLNDDKTPRHFLFDSGSGLTVIDAHLADSLAFPITSESNIHTSGRTILSKESALHRLRVGKHLLLDSITLVIMDLSHISEYLGYPVEGVIGYDLLSHVVTETNIDSMEMRFFKPEGYTYQGKAPALQVTRLESNLFGIMIHVQPDKYSAPLKLNFEMDTGANYYLSFHHQTVKEHKLLIPGKKYREKKGFGVDSTVVKNIRTKIAKVSFGSKTWKRVPAIYEVDPVNNRSISRADGLLGQRLLLDFNITYNLAKRVVYLEERE